MSDTPETHAMEHEQQIADLVRNLHETEQELLRLTAGKLESVSTPSGDPYLLRSAQERLVSSEAALKRSEALLRNAQRLTNMGSWEIDIVHDRLVWSDETYAIFGIAPEQFGGVYASFLSQIHPDDRARILEQSAHIRSKKDGGVLDQEYRIVRPGGEVRTLYERGEIVFDGQGKPVSAAGVVMDITERKALQKDYQSLFEQSALGMGTMSEDGLFLTTNRRFQEMVGYSEHELRGPISLEITHPDDRERDAAEKQKLLRGEVESTSWEKRYVRKDGGIRWANLTLSRVQGATGQPVLSGVVQEITERKQAELELARTSRALMMLSRCNEALIRAESESALLDHICRIAVEVGGYRMASVLYSQDDEQKSILPVSYAGFDGGYFSGIKLSWSADRPEGQGPAGLAIRSGQAKVVSDVTLDPDYAPWLQSARERGYRSVISLPLLDGARSFGIFGLYSAEVTQIHPEEVNLLKELAADLAFGILNLRLRTERSRLLDAATAVSRTVSSSIGDDYFHKLLKVLLESLGAHAGFIAGLHREDEDVVQAICAVVDGELVSNFEYTLKGTPCEDMHDTEMLVIERDVCSRYPHASALADLKSQAYVGMNLVDAAGTAIGTIFVLFRQPLEQRVLAMSMLRLFASRVAAEMIRYKDESRVREQALLLDKAQDAIIVRTLDHRIVYWNQGAERLYGWSAAEVVGRSAREIKVTDEKGFQAAMDLLLQNGEWTGYLTGSTKDGRKLAVECHWTLVKAEDGTPQSILAINTDVTERKRSEEQLRLLEAAVARLNDIVVITEAYPIRAPGPRIVFVNDAFERQTGYSRAEVIGRSPRLLQGPKTSRAELDRIHEALMNREPVRAEVLNYTKSREEFWAELDIVPLTNADGEHTHWVSVKRDITERKRTEAMLQENEARAAHAQKLESIGHLTGGIAHDFNNLLTVIIGNADLLADELTGNRRLAPLAEMVKTAGERAAELTSRLLAFARKQALEPKQVDAAQIIEGMLLLLRRTLGENIQIEAIHDYDPCPVFIDPGQLESAILNLCINARDAMPNGGSLLIECSHVVLDQSYAGKNFEVTSGEYVMIAITDTGFGISPDALEHVFDPFFTTKPKGKGTGLGLSMVYGFTKQSGGNVKIYSEVGTGTVVKLYLPRAVSPQAEVEVKTDSDTATELQGGETVLLVEDDDLVRNHASKLLSDLGYRVIVAVDGKQALGIVRGDVSIDLLFTDVMMPGGMTGPQLAAEVEKLRPGLPVLYTSGYTENAIVHHGRVDAGVNLLHKPYSRRKLAEKIHQALRRPGTNRKE